MKPKYIKPKTKHKSFCIPVYIDPKIKDTIIYSYFDLISQELFAPTLRYCVKVFLFNTVVFGICSIVYVNSECNVYLLLIFCISVLIISSVCYWNYTVESSINKMRKIDLSCITCYAIKITRKYVNNFGSYILCAGNLKIIINKDMYKLCRPNGSILVYCLENKVLFWHPTSYIKVLNITIHSFDDIIYKVRLRHIFIYYKAYILSIIKISISAVKRLITHYLVMLKNIKRK